MQQIYCRCIVFTWVESYLQIFHTFTLWGKKISIYIIMHWNMCYKYGKSAPFLGQLREVLMYSVDYLYKTDCYTSNSLVIGSMIWWSTNVQQYTCKAILYHISSSLTLLFCADFWTMIKSTYLRSTNESKKMIQLNQQFINILFMHLLLFCLNAILIREMVAHRVMDTFKLFY